MKINSIALTAYAPKAAPKFNGLCIEFDRKGTSPDSFGDIHGNVIHHYYPFKEESGDKFAKVAQELNYSYSKTHEPTMTMAEVEAARRNGAPLDGTQAYTTVEEMKSRVVKKPELEFTEEDYDAYIEGEISDISETTLNALDNLKKEKPELFSHRAQKR